MKMTPERKVEILQDYIIANRVIEWLNDNGMIRINRKENVISEDLAMEFAAFPEDEREILKKMLES